MGYRRFHIGYVFAEYDLFNNTNIIQNCIYIYEFSSKGVESLQQTRNFLIPISVQPDQIFLV